MSIRGTWRRLVAMIRRADIDAELRAEMEAHLGLAEDDLIARGLSPAKARERARREFGNPSLAREASREEWGWPSLESYAADLRFGWRMARRHWASTVVAVGALGVGVGATTGVVSTLDAAAHHRYGYSRPGELAILWAKSRRNPQYDEMQISLPELREWQRASRVRVGGFSWTESINVAAERSVERVRAVRVTSELLPLLGVRPAMGRWFTAEDDSPAAANTAVVSYSFWHDRLNARAAALGAPIIINRQPYAVIGVLPRGFEMPMLRDVPVLLSLHGASWASDPAARSLVAVGRFTTGATAAAVAAELNALSEHVERTPAETGQWTVNVDPSRAPARRTPDTRSP